MLSERRTSRVLQGFLVWNAAVALIFQTSEANQTSCNCCNNHAGVPGIPGRNGDPGSPGRDGRDGLDGLDGSTGPTGPRGQQGRPGTHGKAGPQGIAGPQGKAGPQGIAGPEGPRGAPGKTGSQGPPGQMSLINWKECSWKDINDNKDNGKIKDCVFTKKYNNTTLHVYWDGTLRIYGCDDCCKRWYFTFNGAECSGPMPIDGVVYMRTGTNKNLHRHRHIEGHCQNIPKGTIRVGFWVGDCRGKKAADALTGWNSYSRIFIEEMNGPQT